jgi:hypothetical protein
MINGLVIHRVGFSESFFGGPKISGRFGPTSTGTGGQTALEIGREFSGVTRGPKVLHVLQKHKTLERLTWPPHLNPCTPEPLGATIVDDRNGRSPWAKAR